MPPGAKTRREGEDIANAAEAPLLPLPKCIKVEAKEGEEERALSTPALSATANSTGASATARHPSRLNSTILSSPRGGGEEGPERW